MAETLISPGVFTRENDISFIAPAALEAGAAIIGPTVKGPVEVPTVVTSYGQFQNLFGTTFETGSTKQEFLTSIAVKSYFEQGGNSVLVSRVVSGSFTVAANTSIGGGESGNISTEADALLSSIGTNASTNFANAKSFSNVSLTGGSGTGATANFTVPQGAGGTVSTITVAASGQGYVEGDVLTIPAASIISSSVVKGLEPAADALLSSVTADSQTTFASAKSFTGVSLTGGTGTGAVADLTVGALNTGVSTITVTTTGSNYSVGDVLSIASASITSESLVRGLVTTADALLPSVTADADGPFSSSVSFTGISLAGGSGTGAVASLTVGSGNTGVTAITVTTEGSKYVAGDVLTIPAANLTSASSALYNDVTFTLVSDDIDLVTTETAVASADVTFTLVSDDIDTTYTVSTQSANAVSITLNADDIVDVANPFTIETLGKGHLYNNDGNENSDGSLVSGSSDNVRWEIANVQPARGTFSLLVRRGDDSSKNKIILETFNDLSLDPNSENYIERVIGNQSISKTVDGDGNVFVTTVGEYVNRSNFIRVASVDRQTLNYLGNDGLTVGTDSSGNSYSGSLPVAQSGSFTGATGKLFKDTVPNNHFGDISATNTQGLVPENYADAISMLGNKDEYVFNIISAPGLIYDFGAHKTQLDSIISLAETRGDCIAVIDIEQYGATVSNAVAAANTVNSSYAATYWPWLQTQSGTGKNVWIPASVVIPGVYAFTDGAAAPWFAPAGLTRGGISNVIQAERKLTRTQRDTLYNANVNPIATFPGSGISVFGQKTLQKKKSALDRVNVRRLLIDLKKFVGDVSRTLVFEQNTNATRNAFLAQVNPYLDSVVQRQGLYAFRVVMDDTNNTADVIDRNELVGQIYIQPAKTVEYIVLDFTVEPTGASFGA